MISIVTPVYNNPDKLARFLESIERSIISYTAEYEVIVADDGSTIDLKNVLERFKNIIYVHLKSHSGPAAARNSGARAAKGEYLLFFDSDVTLRTDTLKFFLDDFQKGEVAIVGEYDIAPLENSFFARFKALLTESWMPNDKYVSVFALRAAGIKNEIFKRVNGFNEDIKTASIEDYEFGDRLAKAGVKILYDPAITVRHHHPGFLKQARLFYLRAKDWAELFLERGGKFDNWCASPSEGISSIAGFIFILCLAAAFFLNNSLLFIASFMLFIGYLSANVNFIKVAYRRRGAWFVPIAIFVKLPLAIMITLGFFSGVCHFIRVKFIMRSKRHESV